MSIFINMELHTLALILCITTLMQALALFLQYCVHRIYRGLGWWTLGTAIMALGFAFNYLRDSPTIGLIAIVANNMCFIGGIILIYVGIFRFFGQQEPRKWLAIFYLVIVCVVLYCTYVVNDVVLRRFNVSFAIAVLTFLTAWSLFSYRNAAILISIYFLAALALLSSIFFIGHCIELLFVAVQTVDCFSPAIPQVGAYLIALITGILRTFGFIILVNQRLNGEHRQNRENLQLIFDTSPDAIFITRLKDGLVVEVNAGFTNMLGFSRYEIIGHSTLECNIWYNVEDRQTLVSILQQKGFCKNLDIIARCKDGKQVHVMLSSKKFDMQGVTYIFNVGRDITERKHIEMERERLIAELQNALEQIKTLSGIIPICSNCKKIRDDKGYWEQVEAYVSKHTDAKFSHGICPECIKKLYPQLWDEEMKSKYPGQY